MKFCLGFSFILMVVFLGVSWINAREIGFIEDFALAKDRGHALRQLIPGTGDHYYYHCLYYQSEGDYKQVHKILKNWIDREGYSQRVKEIMNRQALLEYPENPSRTLEYIKNELGLRFDHTKETAHRKSDHPSILDPEIIGPKAFLQTAFSRSRNLDGIEDGGLDLLDHQRLSPERRRDLLRRIERPDIPGLAKIVVDELKDKGGRGFGSHPIHRKMLRPQLEEALRLMPELSEDPDFVSTCISKLSPSDDERTDSDTEAAQAHLEGLWGFAEKLSPAHNSLKAHILYHLLDLYRKKGEYTGKARNLFFAYIRIPRNVSYLHADLMKKTDSAHRADLSAGFGATGLPPVFSDEELVRDYLSHEFIDAKDYNAYAGFIQKDLLESVFVETKILNGTGDMEKWYSLMTPEHYQELKDRVDLSFSPANKRFFKTDEPVVLELFIKNIKTLIVKIFEINAVNYYMRTGKEVGADIELDGLVATREKVISYDTPPLLRTRRIFEFPRLNRPGLYVVEFIGNGKSSRAVIRKGSLFCMEKIGPSGHDFTIYDDTNQKRPGASIYLNRQKFSADEKGIVTIPYTAAPGKKTLILEDKEDCSQASFNHMAENYRLHAGFFVERESLLSGREASVLIRPSLMLNGFPVSLSLLEGVGLDIESIDQNGVSTIKEAADFKLHPDKESVFTFQTPKNLSEIRFTLRARVRNLSKGKKDELSCGKGFAVNGIDKTLRVEDLFFRHTEGRHIAEILGKNGEPVPGRPVKLEIKHRHFREPVPVTLQSDENGRIDLGELPDIEWIRASGMGDISRIYRPETEKCRYPERICRPAGEPVVLPFFRPENQKYRSWVLLEKRKGVYVADHTSSVRPTGGGLEIDGLPPGNYELFLKNEKKAIELFVTRGKIEEGRILSGNRALEVLAPDFPRMESVTVSPEEILVNLKSFGRFTRVHVAATRFASVFHPFSELDLPDLPRPCAYDRVPPESVFAAERNIGDEYRYILDRQYVTPYPGNMLEKPELLLNPWQVRDTKTATDEAMEGEAYARLAEKPQSFDKKSRYREAVRKEAQAIPLSNPDFLATPAVVMANLLPDEKGLVRIDRKKLMDCTHIKLIAVDPVYLSVGEITLPHSGRKNRDLTLARSLDGNKHFTEQKKVSIVDPKKTFTLPDVTTSEFEIYDSLARVFRFFVTSGRDETLSEFDFVLKWPEMNKKEKIKAYSRYACHELNFFLHEKDPAFFGSVVVPFLKGKLEKTFLDHWLLKENLSAYDSPEPFSRLNLMEKILFFRRSEPEDEKRIHRFVKEACDLTPPDMDRWNHLFDTAIKGRDLEPAADREALFDTAPEMSAGMMKSMAARAMPEAQPLTAGSAAPPEPEAEESPDFPREDESDDFFPGRKKDGSEPRPFYRKLDRTKEWVENNYYHLADMRQAKDRVSANPFWLDYAGKKTDQPFFSGNFIYATGNFTEMMFALSVLDLPFAPAKHESRITGNALVMNPGSPVIIFHKEIRPAPASREKHPLLISRNYFRADDRYLYVDNMRYDKFVTDEFLVRTAYGCRIVLSNPTSAPLQLRLLLQIPQGSLPLQNGFFTKGMPLVLSPFTTITTEYFFYFPRTGEFPHFPAQAAKAETFIAGTEAVTLKVVARLSKADTESWEYISQNASEDLVLEYLETRNINRIDLAKTAFRCKERGFFDRLVALLKERRVFDPVIWSYGIFHDRQDVIREYLSFSPLAESCGMVFSSPLLDIDPVARGKIEHMVYKPLVNARAHRLGKGNKILNDRFFEQYERLMKKLSYQTEFENRDYLAVTYYLLLQDRISEAVFFFEKVNPADLPMKTAYDYLKVYLSFYSEDLKQARAVAARYLDYPVSGWRDRFRLAAAQIDEVEGKTSSDEADPENRDQVQGRLADTEPVLDFRIESGQITIIRQNLTECRVNYYPMNIELLFSRNPFMQQDTDHFTFIRPNFSQTVQLPPGRMPFTLELPAQFHNSNLMVEIEAQGIKASKVYYANSLDVRIMPRYGHLRVMHRIKQTPLSRTYIKVFARMKGGEVKFYKDGYTDLRGRFDYVSLNTNELDHVERFSILVLHDEFGAVIREAEAPVR